MNIIVPYVQKTSELVQEITAASNEQSMGAQQINKAIQQLDQVIQQNAGASEEMSSMAQDLAKQSDALKRAISFFKLNGSRSRVDMRQTREMDIVDDFDAGGYYPSMNPNYDRGVPKNGGNSRNYANHSGYMNSPMRQQNGFDLKLEPEDEEMMTQEFIRY